MEQLHQEIRDDPISGPFVDRFFASKVVEPVSRPQKVEGFWCHDVENHGAMGLSAHGAVCFSSRLVLCTTPSSDKRQNHAFRNGR